MSNETNVINFFSVDSFRKKARGKTVSSTAVSLPALKKAVSLLEIYVQDMEEEEIGIEISISDMGIVLFCVDGNCRDANAGIAVAPYLRDTHQNCPLHPEKEVYSLPSRKGEIYCHECRLWHRDVEKQEEKEAV